MGRIEFLESQEEHSIIWNTVFLSRQEWISKYLFRRMSDAIDQIKMINRERTEKISDEIETGCK
jgi:hypothetical protein